MDLDQDEIAARAPNLGIQRILEEYRDRWDATHIRQQCEAFATGEPYEISCLDDRRDWDAIEAMVPDEFFGMSNTELRPHYLELQTADDGYGAALNYCRSVGAVE
ncbi:hypothetical protein [Roseitranquillus sediminis]|uniref:hypothetical protein n=1 Tax=Roseitranquillus sediminis TaxID=2809051 RepID=UPI001D0CC4F7|nr:hypothetical protein [Roseitranquillus sediminis]MBM9595052.1 hypothetical protein [Roseitranquillus sediminis]